MPKCNIQITGAAILLLKSEMCDNKGWKLSFVVHRDALHFKSCSTDLREHVCVVQTQKMLHCEE